LDEDEHSINTNCFSGRHQRSWDND